MTDVSDQGCGTHHHDTARAVVIRRVSAVIDRLDVAMQFTEVDTAVAAQVMHAVRFAFMGPPSKTDDDYLKIEPVQAFALVEALLPFVRAARQRPGFEGCSQHDWPPRGAYC